MSTIFNKLNAPSLQDTVKKSLLGKILSGELKPGQWLPAERDMAGQMEVSRSSLHQAILSLNSDGFLKIEPRRGIMVSDYRKHPTPQSLAALMSYDSTEFNYSLFTDMMDARLWLEAECGRCACVNIYESTMEEMQKLVLDMKVPDADICELVYQFHYKLVQASGNVIYSMIFRGFEPIIRTLIRRHYEVYPADCASSAEQHQKILDAISARNEAMAEKVIRNIITRGVEVLTEKYL